MSKKKKSEASLYLYGEKKEAAKAIIRSLIIRGSTTEEMAAKCNEGGIKITQSQLKKLLVDIRKENGERLKNYAKKFKVEEYLAERRDKLNRLTAILYDIAEDGRKEQARVAAANLINSLMIEDERLLNRLGITTSKVDEKDLAKTASQVVFIQE